MGKFVDIKYKKFGKLRAINMVGTDAFGSVMWKCYCECGKIKTVRGSLLRNGTTKNCGCGRKIKKPKPALDIINHRFGRLTATKLITKRGPYGTYKYECECDCGNIISVIGRSLRSGHTKSCGCYKKDKARAQVVKYETREQATIAHVYYQYAGRAHKKGIEFSISKELFSKLIKQNCIYCGGGFDNIRILKNSRKKPATITYKLHYTGIDRKDNSKGYTKENSVSCCKHCNRAKNDQTHKEFQNYLDRLVKFRTEQYKNPKGNIGTYSFMGNTYCGYSQEIN